MATETNAIISLGQLGTISNIFAVFGLGVAVPIFGWWTKRKKKVKQQIIDGVSKQVTEPIRERIEIYFEMNAEQNKAIIFSLDKIHKVVEDLYSHLEELDKNKK